MGWLSKIGDAIGDGIRDVGDAIGDGIRWLGDEIEDVLGLDPDIPEQEYGALLNKTGASNNLPVIYGTRRVGGVRVLLHTQGDKNKHLYSVLAMCEGPIASVKDPLISDESPSDLGITITTDLSRFANGAMASTSDIARLSAYPGDWDQVADSDFVSELGELWTADHTLSGVAYVAARYTYDKDKLASLPTLTAVVEGRLLYDPRADTTAHSSNAALVILDYLRDGIYGEVVPLEEINLDSFKVAADVADRTAVNFSGSSDSYRPLDINAVVDTGKSRLDNMKALLKHARGTLPYIGGQYHLVIRSATESTFEFTDDDIMGDIGVSSSGASDKCNRVTVTFKDPDLNWDDNTVVYPTDDAEYQIYLAEDNGIENHESVTADMITNEYQALDYARQYLLESRKALVISFDALPSARKVKPGAVVTVTTAQLGSFLFVVQKRVIKSDGTYKFTLKEYDPSIYSWINPNEIVKGATPSVVSPYNLPAPTGLQFNPVEYNADAIGELSWNESDSAFVTRYQINVFNTVTERLSWSSIVETDNALVPNLPAGNFRAEVRGVSELSSTPIATITWSYAVPDLPQITGLSQVGEFDDSLTLQWDAVSEKAALREYRVELVVSGVVLVAKTVATETVTFTLSEFEAIGFPRSFDVQVKPVNVALSAGPAAMLAIEKPAPDAPLSVSISPAVTSLDVRVIRSATAKGVVVWMDTTLPVQQADGYQVYRGTGARFTVSDLAELTQYRLAVACYDAFGLGPVANYSATTLQDVVAQSIQQLTERDLSIESDIEAIDDGIDAINEDLLSKQIEIERIQSDINVASIQNTVDRTRSNRQILDAVMGAAQAKRIQAEQNNEYYRILNAVVEIDPSTGTITNRAYEYTNTKFSEANVLIDGVNAAVIVQAGRVDTAESRLDVAESELTVQAGLINSRVTYSQLDETIAGAIAAIQPAYATNFNTGLDGWSAQSGAAVYNAGAWVDMTLGDVASSMSYAGSENPVVQLVVARDAGAVWAGKIQWSTAVHGYSASHEIAIPEVVDDGKQYTVTIDLGEESDYTANTITGLRILLGATTADVYRLYSVQAGKRNAAQAALEGLQGRVSTAEQSISAIEGNLSSYVTTTWFNENALTESDVQTTLDSWDTTYSVTATLTQLASDGTIEKANTAQTWINGAEALIQSIAQATAQDEFGSTITSIQDELDAQAGTISQQVASIYNAGADLAQLKREALNVALSNAKNAQHSTKVADSVAVARSETRAVADELTAEALRVDTLATQLDEQSAAIQNETIARSNADSALASDIQTLQTSTEDNAAAIQNETIARSNADSALTSDIQTLQTSAEDNAAAIQNESIARANADSALASDIQTLQTSTEDNAAAIQTESTARSNADSALASDIQTLQTSTEDNAAAIQNESIARSNADSALASDIQTLQTSTEDNAAAIQVQKEALVDESQSRASVGYDLLATRRIQLKDALSNAENARNASLNQHAAAKALHKTDVLANDQGALAQTVENLSAEVDDNKAEFADYRRAAIGYCVDADGNPTSHETAAACDLAGNTWVGAQPLAEALRKVRLTGTDANGNSVEASAGTILQALLDTDGNLAVTASLLATYGEQLSGIFANVGDNGSELIALANAFKVQTENGSKTPFKVVGDEVIADNLIVQQLRIPASDSDSTPVNVTTFEQLKGNQGEKGDTGDTGEMGPQGPIGPQGVEGEQGPQGMLPAPTGAAGLFANDDYMGYHNGTNWRSYINSDGGFYFEDAAGNYITNLFNNGTLTVKGRVEATEGEFSGEVNAFKFEDTQWGRPATVNHVTNTDLSQEVYDFGANGYYVGKYQFLTLPRSSRNMENSETEVFDISVWVYCDKDYWPNWMQWDAPWPFPNDEWGQDTLQGGVYAEEYLKRQWVRVPEKWYWIYKHGALNASLLVNTYRIKAAMGNPPDNTPMKVVFSVPSRTGGDTGFHWYNGPYQYQY